MNKNNEKAKKWKERTISTNKNEIIQTESKFLSQAPAFEFNREALRSTCLPYGGSLHLLGKRGGVPTPFRKGVTTSQTVRTNNQKQIKKKRDGFGEGRFLRFALFYVTTQDSKPGPPDTSLLLRFETFDSLLRLSIFVSEFSCLLFSFCFNFKPKNSKNNEETHWRCMFQV